MLEFYNETSEHIVDESAISPWLMRFEIDAAKLDGKGLSMDKVERVIRETLKEFEIEIVRSFDGEDRKKHVLRLRTPDTSEEDDLVRPVMHVKQFEEILLQ